MCFSTKISIWNEFLLIFGALSVAAQNSTNANLTTVVPDTTVAPTILAPKLNPSAEERVQNANTNNKTIINEKSISKAEENNKNEVSSPNYPKPYPNKLNQKWTIKSENATGIELIIQFLDIDPLHDSLKIHVGEENDPKNSGFILTGKLKEPLRTKSLYSPIIHIEFTADTSSDHTYGGFLINYTPIDEIIVTTPVPPKEATISPEDLPTYSTYLNVPEADQNNKTWEIFRSLLCEATDNFTVNHNLTLEHCHLRNVSFTGIVKCPNIWPNYINCVELTFTILLFNNETGATTKDPFLEDPIEMKLPTELSTENLKKMWHEYGIDLFKLHGFSEYKAIDPKGEVMFWIGMGCSGIIFLILVLIVISRLRMLRDYVKWRHNDEDNQKILKNQADIDITMFPSPHQIVPTLFPSSTNAYSPSSSFLYGGDVYENRPRELVEGFNDVDPSFWGGGIRINATDNSIVVLETEDNKRSHQDTYLKGGNKDESMT